MPAKRSTAMLDATSPVGDGSVSRVTAAGARHPPGVAAEGASRRPRGVDRPAEREGGARRYHRRTGAARRGGSVAGVAGGLLGALLDVLGLRLRLGLLLGGQHLLGGARPARRD